jgi:hypothetical protein
MTLLEAHEHSARPCARAAPGIPVRQVFIVTRHDHRVDPAIVPRLQVGDAPAIRNAGGRVSAPTCERNPWNYGYRLAAPTGDHRSPGASIEGEEV